MSVRYLLDHHVRFVVAAGLRRRGVDVLAAEEDGSQALPDPELLERATSLGRILVTQDEDFLEIGTTIVAQSIPFPGIMYVSQQRLTDRQLIDELELIAVASEANEWANQVVFLPL